MFKKKNCHTESLCLIKKNVVVTLSHCVKKKRSKTDKKIKNGPKWSKTVQNGPKRSKRLTTVIKGEYGQKMSKNVKNRQK